MPRFNAYLLVAFALSALTTASPLQSVPTTTATTTLNTTATLSLNTTATPPMTTATLQTTTLTLPTTTATPSPTTTATSPPPSNVANGTIIDGCTQFFTVPPGRTCFEIETTFNISDALFHALNPEVNSICTNLIAGEAYCVANSTTPSTIPGNVAPGTITTGCTQFFTLPQGRTCLEVETSFNISDALFHALNPEVNSICTNLIAGEAYCVANSTIPSTIPGNLAPGTITTGCTQFFTVQLGETCTSVEEMFNITNTLFTTLNPEINAECTNLIAGEAYCVAGSA
ncbi:hypothetical protein Clacol_002298 [Clathrus columnatus]|uniref:LysM domain-containing protein n=1 Tax=Clathrus columnatus TaxID=1419009 RepID=A0AAV5A507_9AGAM|nr:hypothetical protein Clacol_002298 [Clathrus columnatus]